MYNFNMFGNCMSYISKLQKHRNNPCRLVDYILTGFDVWDPTDRTNHPCWEHIQVAIATCKAHGWKFRSGVWKELGIQLIALSPDGGYYHSKFNHKEK